MCGVVYCVVTFRSPAGWVKTPLHAALAGGGNTLLLWQSLLTACCCETESCCSGQSQIAQLKLIRTFGQPMGSGGGVQTCCFRSPS